MKFPKTIGLPIVSESPPSRGAWIEIVLYIRFPCPPPSPPSRGAWIEIPCRFRTAHREDVAPLAGGVD